MDQSTKLSVQKGGGCEKTGKIDNTQCLDTISLDCLIDTAVMEWVEAHPEEMNRYNDRSCRWKLFRTSKVIFL